MCSIKIKLKCVVLQKNVSSDVFFCDTTHITKTNPKGLVFAFFSSFMAGVLAPILTSASSFTGAHSK